MRIKIRLPETADDTLPREISFSANLKTKKDLAETLKEIAKILEAPVVPDEELF